MEHFLGFQIQLLEYWDKYPNNCHHQLASSAFHMGSLGSSMTSLLTQNVPHSTEPSSRSKTNNQSNKKFLRLAVSWVKVVKNGKILTFKLNFLCQKLSKSFWKKFSLKNMILGAHFFYWHFLKTSILKAFKALFTIIVSIFCQLILEFC